MAAMTLFFPWPMLVELSFRPSQGRSVLYDQERRDERQ